MPDQAKITKEDLDHCIRLLKRLTGNPMLTATLGHSNLRDLLEVAGRFSRPNKNEIQKRHKAFYAARKKKKQLEDRSVRALTGIREARTASVFQPPPQITSSPQISGDYGESRNLNTPRNCYVCKVEFSKVHFFYDSMCSDCAEFNYKKRFQSAPLHGQVALITGARLKIGYQTSLMLLRAGARVIATTRFPVDAALRFSRESDFGKWGENLQIYGLDLRHIPSVELFSRYLCNTTDRLDILINNAAQTVRRPADFYSHLLENEKKPLSVLSKSIQDLLEASEACKNQLVSLCKTLPDNSNSARLVAWHSQVPGIGLRASALLSLIPYTYDNSMNVEEIFPGGHLDSDLQQVDLRKTNSWRLKLGEVAAAEMLEVQLVNSVAPFVLCSQLLPLMTREFTGKKHIVNVSAMEGKFHRYTKTDRHPHTNMAKAALNMLTHTSASDLEKKGIFMNAVDTGWVTDEDPIDLSMSKREMHDFQPPLDIVDGAARVCDPFFDGILTGKHWSGKFLKDYKPIDW